MEGNFADATFAANSGNASWTVMGVFNATTLGAILNSGVFNSTGAPWQVVLSASKHSAGDLCVAWGTSGNHADMCTAGGVLTTGQWYFITVSARANASGYPTITMYVGTTGMFTEYGGDTHTNNSHPYQKREPPDKMPANHFPAAPGGG